MIDVARLQIHQISKQYTGKQVVNALLPVDIDVVEGEFLTILGPSGSGKTTLLHVIVGVVEPTAGQVLLDDVDITRADPRDRDMAMVFQNYALYPSKTVRGNLEFPLRMQKIPRDERRERSIRMLETLGLAEMGDRYPRELSGGQQQRVALGRAMIRQPKLFLMDEPLSNLDTKLRLQMRTEIKRLHREFPVTTLYVTHDQSEAMALSDRIVVMNKGVINQIDAPDAIYRRPANKFVAGFVGVPMMNFVLVDLRQSGGSVECRTDDGQILCAVDRQQTDGTIGKAELGIRPAHLRWRPAAEPDPGGSGPWISATVHELDALGDEDTLIYANVGDLELTITERDHRQPEIGDHILINFPPESVHLFAADDDGRSLAGGSPVPTTPEPAEAV